MKLDNDAIISKWNEEEINKLKNENLELARLNEELKKEINRHIRVNQDFLAKLVSQELKLAESVDIIKSQQDEILTLRKKTELNSGHEELKKAYEATHQDKINLIAEVDELIAQNLTLKTNNAVLSGVNQGNLDLVGDIQGLKKANEALQGENDRLTRDNENLTLANKVIKASDDHDINLRAEIDKLNVQVAHYKAENNQLSSSKQCLVNQIKEMNNEKKINALSKDKVQLEMMIKHLLTAYQELIDFSTEKLI